MPKLRTDTESEAIHRWNRLLAPHSLFLQTPDGDGCLGSAPTTAAQVASDLPPELFRKVGRQAKHAFIRKAFARSGRAQRGSPWSLLSGRREAPGSGQRRSWFVPKPPQRRTPHDHQRETVANIVAGFRTADRGQAMMACGTQNARRPPRRRGDREHAPRTPSAPFATSRSARMRRWWPRTQSCRGRVSSPSTAGTTLYPRVVE